MENPIDKLILYSYMPFTDRWQKRIDKAKKNSNWTYSNNINRLRWFVKLDNPSLQIKFGRVTDSYINTRTGEIIELPQSAIIMNPNKLGYRYGEILGLIEDIYGAIDRIYVHRVDFKLDDREHDINYYSKRILLPYKRAIIEYRAGHVSKDIALPLETLRFGKGKDVFQIYDKRKELIAHEGVDPGHTITRLEHQRYLGRQEVLLTDIDEYGQALFEGVNIYDPSKLSSQGFEQKLKLRLKQGYPLTRALDMLPCSRATQSRLRATMMDISATQALNDGVRVLWDRYFYLSEYLPKSA